MWRPLLFDPFDKEKCYKDNPFFKGCLCKKCLSEDKNPFRIKGDGK
jgi:hypothetical protein